MSRPIPAAGEEARHSMVTPLRCFFHDECGQDLVEYSLLLAFIALAGAAAYLGMSRSTNTILSVANSRLAAANNPS